MQHDANTELFLLHRDQLRRLAYRMLGSVSLAEEAVQETWLRWHAIDLTEVASGKAWLITTLSRICIDELRRLKLVQKNYIGPWLPEPIFTESEADPAEISMKGVSISMALLVLMERLSPEERVAFLLQEIFDHDYKSTATILGKAEASCRQLVHRARAKIEAGKARFTVSSQLKNELLSQFAGACLNGDLTGLLNTLAPDVRLISDGGGVVKAATKPVYGPRAVSRLLIGIRKIQPAGSYVFPKEINNEMGVAGYTAEGKLYFTIAFELSEQGITGIFLLNNPDKLMTFEFEK